MKTIPKISVKIQKLLYNILIFLLCFNIFPSFAFNSFTEIADFQEIESLPEARQFHQCLFLDNYQTKSDTSTGHIFK